MAFELSTGCDITYMIQKWFVLKKPVACSNTISLTRKEEGFTMDLETPGRSDSDGQVHQVGEIGCDCGSDGREAEECIAGSDNLSALKCL